MKYFICFKEKPQNVDAFTGFTLQQNAVVVVGGNNTMFHLWCVIHAFNFK